MTDIFDTVIVGAGISGLVAGSRIQAKGNKVVILEKSRSVGGRIATRRDDLAIYDHGAQFYKIPINSNTTTDDFWTQKNISQTWFTENAHHFKSSAGGLTHLAKSIAEPLEIIFNEKLIQIKNPNESQKCYQLICETGNIFLSKQVILSCPLPQTVEILKKSNMAFPHDLEKIIYAKALVGLFEVQSSNENLRNFKYQSNINSAIFSASNQLSKNVSKTLAFSCTMTPDWSEIHFDESEESILWQIQIEFNHFIKSIDEHATIVKSQLKKWRLSHPHQIYESLQLDLLENGEILLIGDAFGGASISGAIRSAESISI